MTLDIDQEHPSHVSHSQICWVATVIAITVIVLGLLFIPDVSALLAMLVIWGVFVLAIFLATMILGWLGWRVFRGIDWLVAWQKREPDWFQPTEGSDSQ